ncbi:hypothetical protein AAFF_G00217950 [Aldrovandia affinis]|uniref:Uncharacterized protein n=1 Tax=Aldrovandia affinis TaxID=143900 RepID=A0AAD7WUA0_9TELE|nr:hypothetical protein AAFF_G00217950 [Aldrovandia affinis]
MAVTDSLANDHSAGCRLSRAHLDRAESQRTVFNPRPSSSKQITLPTHSPGACTWSSLARLCSPLPTRPNREAAPRPPHRCCPRCHARAPRADTVVVDGGLRPLQIERDRAGLCAGACWPGRVMQPLTEAHTLGQATASQPLEENSTRRGQGTVTASIPQAWV